MANVKTNAMRILDREKIKYMVHTYDVSDGAIDGRSVAEKTNEDPKRVFKTLVTVGKSKQNYVFVIPVERELDLKKAAKSVSEKSIEMIKQKELQPLTGYIHGGCSPIGMKKVFTTIVDSSCENYESILVSGGKIGLQIEISPVDLKRAIGCGFDNITV